MGNGSSLVSLKFVFEAENVLIAEKTLKVWQREVYMAVSLIGGLFGGVA